MAFHTDYSSKESELRHSCDKYRDAAAGARLIQCWQKLDGNIVELDALPGHEYAPDFVQDAEYKGFMAPEEVAQKVGELSLRLEAAF